MTEPPEEPPEPLISPHQFRGYLLQSRLDHSQTYPTYRAIHLLSGDPVALTVLPRMQPADSERMQRRFHARRGVDHGNIARLREEGIRDPIPWYTSDLHEGIPLSYYLVSWTPILPVPKQIAPEIRDTLPSLNAPISSPHTTHRVRVQRRLSEDEVQHILTLGCKICDALSDLHQQGFFHGNISSQTILLRTIDHEPVLLDPGLWQPSSTTVEIPPEILAGEPPSSRSDVYSVGVILYELLSGLPFKETLEHDSPLPLSSLTDLPKPLCRQIHGMLAPNPLERPPSPTDCAMVLTPFLKLGQISQPRFIPTLGQSTGHVEPLHQIKHLLFEKGHSSVFLKTEQETDPTGIFEAITVQASARGWKVYHSTEFPWPLPFGAFEHILWALEDPTIQEPPVPSWEDVAYPVGIARTAYLDQAEQFLKNGEELYIFEHIDRLDDLSKALLIRLIQSGLPRRFLLASTQPWPFSIQAPPKVMLSGLSQEDIGILIKNLLGTPRLPPGLLQAFVERDQKDPWEIRQQLVSLIERGHLFRDEIGAWRCSGETHHDFNAQDLLPLPKLLQERLENLPSLAWQILAAIVQLKTSAPTAWIFTMVGIAPDDSDGLEMLDLLLRDHWVIRLPLGQIALSARCLRGPISNVDKKILHPIHQNAIELFEVSAHHWHLGRLAHHLEQVGNTSRSAEIFEELGCKAWRMGAPVQAKRCWERALLLLSTGDDSLKKPRIQRRIALSLIATGELAQVQTLLANTLQDLSAILTQSPSPPSVVLLDVQREQILVHLQSALLPNRTAIERIHSAWSALQIGEELSPTPRSLALAYSILEELLPSASHSLPTIKPSWSQFRRLLSPSQEAAQWLRQGIHWVHYAQWPQAERILRRSVSRAYLLRSQLVWLRASIYLGLALFFQGEFLQCEEVADTLIQKAHDEPEAPSFAHFIQAEIAMQRGNYTKVVELLSDFPTTVPRHIARASGLRALALQRERQPAQVSNLAKRTLLDHPSLLEAEAVFCAIQALLEDANPRAHTALIHALLRSIQPLAKGIPVLTPRIQLVERLLKQKQYRLNTILKQARSMDIPYTTALILQEIGHTQHDQEAENALEEAETLLHRLRS